MSDNHELRDLARELAESLRHPAMLARRYAERTLALAEAGLCDPMATGGRPEELADPALLEAFAEAQVYVGRIDVTVSSHARTMLAALIMMGPSTLPGRIARAQEAMEAGAARAREHCTCSTCTKRRETAAAAVQPSLDAAAAAAHPKT